MPIWKSSLTKEIHAFLLEATAGQGSSVGWRFEHLAHIIERVHTKIPIGVCIDTCHIFSAGYDIRTKKGWDETLEQFDKIVGLKHLYAFHLNDSMKPFAARKDRHAPLGKGEIGIECFKVMMTHPLMRELPKYLETPDGPPLWKEEIALLKRICNMKHIKIKKIQPSDIGKTLNLCGWIRTVREQKNFAFIELNDGSTFSNLQIIVEETVPHYAELLKQLSTGASIGVTGQLVESPGQKQKWELKASDA